MKTLLRNGTLVFEDHTEKGDLLIEGELIAAVGGDIVEDGVDRVIDVGEKFVMPGCIDAHTHPQLVSYRHSTREDFAATTRAAACGGVTMIMDFVVHEKGESLQRTIERRRADGDGHVCIDYGLHGNVTDITQGQLDELETLVELGVPSLKIYTTYKKTNLYLDDYALVKLLERSRAAGMLVEVHAENHPLVVRSTQALLDAGKTSCRYHGEARPGLSEIEAASRCILFAKATDAPIYIVHNSMPETVRLLAEARAEGVPAISESCTQYLTLHDEVFEREHPEDYACTPPIRPKEKMLELQKLLKQGYIQVLGSDHCGYTRAQKRDVDHLQRTAQGLPGVETSFQVMYATMVATGQITIEHLSRMMSANPAKTFGLYPRKGVLAVGSDADILIYDPHGEHTLTDDDLHGPEGSYTPWTGLSIPGRVDTTISRGAIVYEDGEFKGGTDHGRFVPGEAFDPAVVDQL